MSTTDNDVRLYKRLLQYVLPYWRTFLIAIVSMLVLAISDPAIPALIRPMLDGAFGCPSCLYCYLPSEGLPPMQMVLPCSGCRTRWLWI